ncbi:LuxR family two component transcriptional regulator [Thiogranum longum]|uniref:LuxR family two component transcriptional regulator n=1 Tax=Thiogranum longum TaxID=1537524 RepID=A0A4R1HC19_9GAMM|nr:UvrY/SirA/GacA family response regulator transcription factor [Thiogranum longum]TCK18151.1 LuxR family two component transcriptional regulator [Thiogranum longum]
MVSEIRILLVDHQSLVRSGIQRLLEDDPQFSVVGEASTGEEAVELARSVKPDVVLMDVQIPGIGGMEATRRICRVCPDTGVVVVTVDVSDPFPAQLLEAGASGYLTKHCDVDEITDAIRAVARGERYISADIAREMALSMLPGKEQSPFDRLSQREMQVMLMVAQGQSVHHISDLLCLSPKTVSTYRYRLYDKLGVDNDVELTHMAIRHGIVTCAAPT